MVKEISLEEKINKKSEKWSDKIINFFNKIKFINLTPDLKEQVALKVKNDIVTWRLYWIQIFLSSIIAALGLLQNAGAVVIGAMLIAPFLRPINAVSFSVSKGERHLFWLSLKILLLSIFVSILMWYLSSKIVWLSYETNEILSRTSPNILDLFIAIFSAMIAVLSLWFTRLWESVAWVAIAASLMPPLATVWIELSLKNYSYAYWSMMLFIANLVAIILVWIVIFWLYWFTPNTWDREKASVKTFTFIVIVMVIISIPLFQSLFSIKEKAELKKDSRVYLENILKKENSTISILNLEVDSINDEEITITSTIKLPEGINFYDTFKKQLDFELSKKLWKKVILNIDLIRSANIVSTDTGDNTENKIYNYITENLKKNYSKYNLISLEVNKDKDIGIYYVKLILWVKDPNFDKESFSSLESKVRTLIKDKIEFSYIPLSINNEKESIALSEIENNKIILENEYKLYLNGKMKKWISLKDINVDISTTNKTKVVMFFDVETGSIIELNNLLTELKVFSDSKNIDLEIKFFTYKEIDL